MLCCVPFPSDILTSMGLRRTTPNGIQQVIILSPSCRICYHNHELASHGETAEELYYHSLRESAIHLMEPLLRVIYNDCLIWLLVSND